MSRGAQSSESGHARWVMCPAPMELPVTIFQSGGLPVSNRSHILSPHPVPKRNEGRQCMFSLCFWERNWCSHYFKAFPCRVITFTEKLGVFHSSVLLEDKLWEAVSSLPFRELVLLLKVPRMLGKGWECIWRCCLSRLLIFYPAWGFSVDCSYHRCRDVGKWVLQQVVTPCEDIPAVVSGWDLSSIKISGAWLWKYLEVRIASYWA